MLLPTLLERGTKPNQIIRATSLAYGQNGYIDSSELKMNTHRKPTLTVTANAAETEFANILAADRGEGRSLMMRQLLKEAVLARYPERVSEIEAAFAPELKGGKYERPPGTERVRKPSKPNA